MIIVRRYFSNTNEGTESQRKSRKGAGKAIAAASSGALLGAGIKAKIDSNKFKNRISAAYDKAINADSKRRDKVIDDVVFYNNEWIKPEYRERAEEAFNNLDKTKKQLQNASNRFKKRADKLIPKVTTKGAIKGAAVGGLVGAGLYYGLKKGKDLVAKKGEKVDKEHGED